MHIYYKYICFKHFLCVLLILFEVSWTNASISDYINGISRYLGYSKNANGNTNTDLMDGGPTQKVLYEVSAADEKFIAEAAKLTGVAISELDFCQQRVVLKLKSDCNKLNDEQLAKIAVHLLNCQSYVEGRQIYPCTEEMSIKDCTINMDADTWTSYHLMSNRARAVCYTIRQIQFTGMAEQTVNRLMEASRNQLNSIGKIVHGQESIRNIAENTHDTLTKAYEQQENLQKAQLHGQLAIENNIMRLIDEKRLIHETHEKLIEMTREIQNRLEQSVAIVGQQNEENKINHKELLEDISLIQSKAEDLFEKIDAYSDILLTQNKEFKQQYEATLENLHEVNQTIHGLITLMAGTKVALEEKLAWISSALGGTDKSLGQMYLVVWHTGFILTAMLMCAFLSANLSTRLIVTALPPINLAAALFGQQYLDVFLLCGVTGLFVFVTTLVATYRKTVPLSIRMPSSSSSSAVVAPTSGLVSTTSNSSSFKPYSIESVEEINESEDRFSDTNRPLTPPISRIGSYTPLRSRSRSKTPSIILHNTSGNKTPCQAITRAGTVCKISALPGRDFCFRHQNGDSIMELSSGSGRAINKTGTSGGCGSESKRNIDIIV